MTTVVNISAKLQPKDNITYTVVSLHKVQGHSDYSDCASPPILFEGEIYPFKRVLIRNYLAQFSGESTFSPHSAES